MFSLRIKVNLFLLAFGYTLVATLINYFIYQFPKIGIDDANIYFIYMRHFANGNGFVYNLGGERVEGFTSLLWTLIGSTFFKLSKHPEQWLFAFNIIVITIGIWQIILYLKARLQNKNHFNIAVSCLFALLLAIPGYFSWSVLSLMESGLWSTLIILLCLNLAKVFIFSTKKLNIELAILIILAILCRPESYLWIAMIILIRFFQTYLENHRNLVGAISSSLLPLLCFCFSMAFLILWRIKYFGYPLPNTYYAKVSSDRLQNGLAGIKYDLNFLKDYIPFLLFGVYIYIKLISTKRNYSFSPLDDLTIFFVVTIITFAIPLFSGGDHFNEGRIIEPTIPIIYLFIILVLITYFKKLSIKIYQIGLTSLVIFGVYYNKHNIQFEFQLAEDGRLYSSQLSSFFKENSIMPVQGVLTAGGSAFNYTGKTIDLLGLNNVEMAHSEKTSNIRGLKNHAAFNKSIFYKQRPDILYQFLNFESPFIKDTTKFMSGFGGSEYHNSWIYKVFKGIYDDTLFKKLYVPVIFSKKGSKENLFIYSSYDFLKSINKNYYSFRIIKLN